MSDPVATPASTTPDSSATISIDDFLAVELRVGRVIEAFKPEWSNKLIQLRVDFGEATTKTIFTGVRQWYSPLDFEGKKFIFVTNLPARKMGEGLSEGMILLADDEETLKPMLLSLPDSVPLGSRVH